MRVGQLSGEAALDQSTLTLERKDDGCAAVRSSPLPSGEGSFEVGRDIEAHALAAALVCAGGGDRPPRGDRLAALLTRLRSGEPFTATLCGARIEADGDKVLINREPGELTRRPPPPLPLTPGVEAIWDGRWAITADEPGWSVVPAAGRLAALSDPDRAVLKALSPVARTSEPVLIRNAPGAPVLARTAAQTRSLVEQRLALALDRMTHERDLGAVFDGETLRNPLFST